MKKILLSLAVSFLMGATTFAQETSDSKTVFEQVTGIKKKTDKFNLYLNMQSGFRTGFGENGLVDPRFNIDQMRIEARGHINDRVSYRWRQRLNRANSHAGTIDNAPTSIDIAGIGFKFSPKFSMFAGRQCAAYGGFEFDLNPIEIYKYSNMIDNMSNFMTGVSFAYQIADQHELVFQALNSLNNKFEITYSGVANQKVSTLPLVYSLNWNGSLFDNMFNTRWSASLMSQSEKKNLIFISLGNELVCSKDFNMYVDIMYSKEGVDRKGILSGAGPRLLDVDYLTLLSHFNYKVAPKLNLFAKGIYETASLSSKANVGIDVGQSSFGYQFGVECYPMNDHLRFSLVYMGGATKQKGIDKYLLKNEIFAGFIYQIPMF